MIKDILQIPIAIALFMSLIFVVLCYAKPRRDQSEFIIDLLNNLSKKDEKPTRKVKHNVSMYKLEK